MRLGQPNQRQSVPKRLALLLLAAVCLFLAGCHLWYQDMKGYLEYWTGTVSIGDVKWSASPSGQEIGGVATISSNATISASVDIINPDGYPLDGGIGAASDTRRSVRISGDAGSAALAKASVISSSTTGMEVKIAPLSQVPTPASLALEHKNFTVEFTPTRSDNAVATASTRSLTLRYNTPPRMPLEVVYNQSTGLGWMENDEWEVVQGALDSALDDLIFWAYPSGITDSTHPNYVVKFEVYEDGELFDEYTTEECRMSGQTNLKPFVPQDLKSAGYNIYCSLASTGKEITIYAVDSEGVRSLATTSGRAPHPITLKGNGGTFRSGSDSVTVYRAAGAILNGGDLDIPTKSGYYLSGWTASGTTVTFPYTVSASVTFTAQWTAETSSDGGSSPVTPPAPDPHVMYVNPASGEDTRDGLSAATALKTLQAAVDKIVAANDGTNYTILLMGDIDDSSSGAYDTSRNSALVNIAPTTNNNLNLTIKSNVGGTKRTIDAGRDSNKTGRVFYVGANASVTLQDVVVTGGKLGNENGGGVYVYSGGIFIMNDGIISHNYAGFNGGGVYVSQNATFIMRGGSIKANEVGAGAGNESGGGGVYVNGGTFTMEDGKITQNNGLKNGGGVYVGGDGTLSMSGGEISSNTVTGDGGGVYIATNASLSIIGTSSPRIAYNSAKNGGGVYIVNMGILGMGSGSISGNTATQEGAGVYDNGMVSLGGSASISSTNVFYLSGTADPISITSTLTESSVASIYVSGAMDGKQVLQAGQGSNVILANEVSKFTILPDGTDSWSIDTNGQLVK